MLQFFASRLSVLLSAAVVFVAGPAALAQLSPGASSGAGLKIVELYTSQSCPNSPQADENLRIIASRPDVLALTLPVTYWDYFGWRDTLAHKAFDERQEHYVDTLDAHWLYTPQIVVNGIKALDGEKLSTLAATLDETLAVPALAVIPSGRDGLTITLPRTGPGHAASLVFVSWHEQPVSVDVKGGKNAGKKLSYTNVVHTLIKVDEVEPGETGTIGFTMPEGARGQPCAVFLQDAETGEMAAAARCGPGYTS
ncbi:DUF1223 domain-containing protein [Aquisalinus flavus]|uniref:DUF1223 domain-containing protein n=1 Tax=Aquisalinus flavus TaxID=1526572 RepID=A0A8J2V293_9PROT|nr:DUF1223 domain-containing protein [Aquisalinus flavus]MBD0425310.1 DUF1223 domain-containing protein [Aquisalinus flavus]UNE49037.1 DUF1223 domain-containing protein [Aquisalinus flavus]GGD17090.1 hypothetical protein GCM10011342_27340 [Aquisalinus flavus]